MTDEKKIINSKRLIFLCISIGAMVAAWQNYLNPLNPIMFPYDTFPHYDTFLGLVLSAVFILALYLGSRGVGRQLTISHFLKLVFGYPCWIPLVAYFLFGFFFSIILGRK